MSVLARDLFEEYLADCNAVGINPSRMRLSATASLLHHRQPKERRYREILDLEDRWYRSLAADEPDWGVYGENAYVADLWACWVVYSRKYLTQIQSPKSLPAAGGIVAHLLPDVSAIADLGCGLGYTTAALAELFPDAEVVGTNLDGISQTEIARRVGARYGFRVVPDPASVGPADLVFASEYFEHFPNPVDHLRDVLDEIRPKALIVANAFGARSIGHFDVYQGNVPGSKIGREFGSVLRRRGYRRVETKLWNNRPAYWRRDS